MAKFLGSRIGAANLAVLPVIGLVVIAVVLAVVLATLGARKTDELAIESQGSAVLRAMATHAESIGERGIPQIFWQEAAEQVAANDVAFMDDNYGSYLTDLLGYRWSFVIDASDAPIYAAADGGMVEPEAFLQFAAVLAPYVDQLRRWDPEEVDGTGYVEEVNAFPNGETINLRIAANIDLIDGRPSVVTVSTIVPDLDPAGFAETPPPLLIGIADITQADLDEISFHYGFRDLQWVDERPEDQAGVTLTNRSGEAIATLAWLPERPAADFISQLRPALIACLIILALAGVAAILVARALAKAMAQAAVSGHDARVDALTGLANRRALSEALGAAFERHIRDGSDLALVSLDLDRFKELNDGFGHVAGDSALKQIAARIDEHSGDDVVVARVGGDEFILMVEKRSRDQVLALAQTLIDRIGSPMYLGNGLETTLGCSAGVAFGNSDSAEALERQADLAVTAAKHRGRNRFEVFDVSMEARLRERLDVERELRQALRLGQLTVAYQPIFEAGALNGAEALLRWRHPVRGDISPEYFLPRLEGTSLMTEIGNFVLAQVIAQAPAWKGIRIGVNLSVRQVLNAEIVNTVAELLRQHQVTADQIEIELTETALIEDEDRTAATIAALQKIGVRVALDDMGAGYSSLSHLKRFAFDKVKIDRSLVAGIGREAYATEMVFSIIRIARALGIDVTAEGVETEAQREFLAAAGCEALQGYLLGRAMSAKDFEQLLERRARNVA